MRLSVDTAKTEGKKIKEMVGRLLKYILLAAQNGILIYYLNNNKNGDNAIFGEVKQNVRRKNHTMVCDFMSYGWHCFFVSNLKI